MHIQGCDSGLLEELTRRRNQIAHELVNALDGGRITQQHLAKEREMNAYTDQISQLRRARGQQS